MLNPISLRSSIGAIVLFALAASTAAAQSGRTLTHQLTETPELDALTSNRPVPRDSAYPLAERHRGALETWVDPLHGGGLIRPTSHAAVITSSHPVGGNSRGLGTGLRDAAKMGLIGAGIGAVAGGMMELVDPHGEIADIWPVLLAIPGFLGGVVYSVVR